MQNNRYPIRFYKSADWFMFSCDDGLSMSYPRNKWTVRDAWRDFYRLKRSRGTGIPYLRLSYIEI